MADLSIRLNPATLRLKFISSLILAIALTGGDYRYALTDRGAPALSLIVQPLVTVASMPAQFFSWLRLHFSDIEKLSERNQALRQQVLEQLYQIHALTAMKEENRRLRALAGLQIPHQPERTLVAEVTQVGVDTFRQTLTINRGSQDGVYVGQPALDAHGIIGQISSVGPFQSTVLLITDISHAILVRNARTEDHYLAHGSGHGLKLRYVPRYNDIQRNDILLTSGLDDTYPPEHAVGRIAQITTHPGRDFREADVHATARFHGSQEILLIWYRKPVQEPDDAD